MRSVLIYLLPILLCMQNVDAQTFSIPLDTTKAVIPATGYMYNNIKNISSGVISIDWQVVSHDFPPDWQTTFAVCDNITCYYNGSNGTLMNANGTGAAPKTTDTFGAGRSSMFYVLMDLKNANPGSHYVKMNMTDGSTSKDSWYFVSKWPTGVVTVDQSSKEFVAYPNPAGQEVNVLYSKASGVSKVELLSLYGQTIGQYQAGNEVTKINLENVSAGIYFVRLLNVQGQQLGTIRVDHK